MNEMVRNGLIDRAFSEEVCTCGMPRATHSDSEYGARGHGPLVVAHGTRRGNRVITRVVCEQYTWDGKSGPFASDR